MATVRERLEENIKNGVVTSNNEKSSVRERLSHNISLANPITNKKNKIDIFKTPENFKNGYQFGDVTNTTLSTLGDVGSSVIEGILRFGEEIGDLGQYGVAQVSDWLGADKFADSVRNNAQQDAISQLYDITGINKLNDNSVAGETTNQVAQGVGNVIAMSNAGALLPKGIRTVGTKNFKMPTTSIASGAGSGITEAYKNGATDSEAWGYGLGAGVVEGFSESLFGGLGNKFKKVYGGGSLDDVFIKKITNNIANKTLKTLTESGLKAAGEGLEEVVSGLGSSIVKKMTYLSDEDFSKIVENENLLDQFIMGTLTSAVMQAPSTYNSVKTRNDYINLENNNTITASNTDTTKYSYMPTNNEKSNKLRQSASQYFTNSQETIDMIDTMDKVIKDKGYNILFDDAIKNKKGQSVNAQITTLENGEIEIRINPNSSRAGEFLLTHEITHAIETDSMKKLILDYASGNAEFNQSLESLKQAYGVEDVSSEVVADISGQLLGNQEFINSLSMQEPSMFKRIYNKIIELANKITGNSNEALFIKDLKNKWETAYRNTTTEQAVNNLENKVKHSIIYNNDGSFNRVKINDNVFENNGGKSINQTIHDYIKEHIGEIYTIIESGQKVYLGEDLPGEYTYSKSAQSLPTTNKLAKGRAASNFKEIVENVNNRKWEKSEKAKHKKDAKYGFYKYDTTFSFDYNGNEKVYTGTVLIRNAENGKKYLYDILNIKPQKKLANLPPVASNSNKSLARFGGSSNQLVDNISQSNNVVKSDTSSTKYSMQETVNNTQELDNSSFYLEEKLEKYVYPRVYEQYKNENKAIINETIEELKHQKEELDTSTDDGWSKNFLINQKIKALEDGYNNVYEHLVEKEKDRLRREVKSERGLGYNLLQEAIEQEKKNNQLQEDINNSTPLKNAQFEIIQKYNPAPKDSNYVWIRSPKDIKTFDEVINDEDSFTWGDYSKEDALNDLKRNRVVIYSSYPIKQGVFVSTSYIQAQEYAGGEGERVYSKQIRPDCVAWINGDEGQYAKVDSTKYSNNNQNWQEHLEKNYKATGTRTDMNRLKEQTLPTYNETENAKKKKVLNPLEVSKLTPEDANTTPKLPKAKVKIGDGESSFYGNVTRKTNMLTEESQHILSKENDIQYYEKIANKESLDKAYERLQKNGASETLNWFNKDSTKATDIDVAEGWILMKQYQDASDYDSMVQVAKKMRDIGTKAGQTVQAFNIMARLTPEGMVKYAQSELSEAFEKMSKNKTVDWIEKYRSDFDLTPSEVQFIVETMQEVQKMKDGYDKKVKLAEIQKLMTDKLPPERGAGMKSWMRISMLFNPKTQVRNVMGNALIAPVNALGDVVASIADKSISKSTGVRTTGTTNTKNYLKGFKQGLYQSYNDFKKGINTRNVQGNRFEVSQGKSFNDKTKVGKALNRVDNILSFMLDAGDRSFYEASFTNSINNQMVLNNTTEVTQEMIDIATQEALSRTWQDNNEYTKFVLNVRKALNAINIKGYGLGDVLIPFAKTPANLTKAIIDYSPVGLVSTLVEGKNLKNSLKNGQYNAKMQHQFVQDLGKTTAGSLLYVIGYALAKAGIMTGESDEDKDVSNFMKNTLGTNSYSIKIGDKSFTYDWAQPIAAPFAMMSNLVQKQKENTNLFENITSVLDTGLNVIFEQSFLESINDVLSEPGEIGTKISEQLLELPSRAIPTLSKQIVDLIDETQRQSFVYGKPLETALNKVKSKIPGLSTTLAPSVDTMGREIQKYGGKNNIFNVFLNPANVNTENISESAKEIYRVYKETGDSTVMPRQVAYYINRDGEKIVLTNSQRTEYQKISGSIIENNVYKLLDNEHYNKLSDDDKATVINDIVNYSYNKAREQVLNIPMSDEYNQVNKWVEAGGEVYDYYSNEKENSYSLQYPEKYNIMQNAKVDYYDYKDYAKKVAEIKEKYSGSENSAIRKQKVFEYVNSLSYNKAQKIILFNMLGNYSITNYKNIVFEYVNSLDINKKEKQKLWEQIYGK